jgi:hypothetical protein
MTSKWTPNISSVPMATLRRPLSTETVRAWGIDVTYNSGHDDRHAERAVMVFDHRIFDVEFNVGEADETIAIERSSGHEHILTEVITVEVEPRT